MYSNYVSPYFPYKNRVSIDMGKLWIEINWDIKEGAKKKRSNYLSASAHWESCRIFKFKY